MTERVSIPERESEIEREDGWEMDISRKQIIFGFLVIVRRNHCNTVKSDWTVFHVGWLLVQTSEGFIETRTLPCMKNGFVRRMA